VTARAQLEAYLKVLTHERQLSEHTGGTWRIFPTSSRNTRGAPSGNGMEWTG